MRLGAQEDMALVYSCETGPFHNKLVLLQISFGFFVPITSIQL